MSFRCTVLLSFMLVLVLFVSCVYAAYLKSHPGKNRNSPHVQLPPPEDQTGPDYNDIHSFYPSSLDNSSLGSARVIDYTKKIKVIPISLAEFKYKVFMTSNKYDFLRIFLQESDLPDTVIDDMIDAGSIETSRQRRKISLSSLSSRKIANPDLQLHGHINLPLHDFDDEPYHFDGVDHVYDFLDEIESHPLFQCRLPQPEILKVGNSGETGKVYYPDCIIVHRCRNVSGCCENNDEICAPKTISIFRRPFFVLKLTKSGRNMVQPEKELVEYRMFINHTECFCKKMKIMNGCNKLCPVPFAVKHGSTRCKCVCPYESRRCRMIEYGSLALQSSQLVCIKNGRCLLPSCKTGKFNVRSGYCPMTFLDSRGRSWEKHHTSRRTVTYKSKTTYKTFQHIKKSNVPPKKQRKPVGTKDGVSHTYTHKDAQITPVLKETKYNYTSLYNRFKEPAESAKLP